MGGSTLSAYLDHIKQSLRSYVPAENDAVVFDIDDTLIDQKTKQVIQPVYDFYTFLKERMIIFIITARPDLDKTIEYTKNELTKHNIREYKSIYFRKVSNTDIRRYKLYARKDILDKGYNILISIGDKEWDIGEYGGIGILVSRN
jgi:predicted secreted acid phosphatase